MKDGVLLAEIAEVLASHGGLRCAPTVEVNGDKLVLSFELSYGLDLAVTSLMDDLQHVIDHAQIRMLAARYGVDQQKLEALLPRYGRD